MPRKLSLLFVLSLFVAACANVPEASDGLSDGVTDGQGPVAFGTDDGAVAEPAPDATVTDPTAVPGATPGATPGTAPTVGPAPSRPGPGAPPAGGGAPPSVTPPAQWETGGPGNRTGVNAKELHIGITGFFEGDFASDALKAFKAYFAEVNQAGGVHGRQLVVHYESTGDLSAEGGVDAARRVEKVVLFNCECQGVDNAVGAAQYLDQRGVPHFLDTGTEAIAAQLRHGYIFVPTTEDFMRRTLEFMANDLGLRGKKIGMVRSNFKLWQPGDAIFNDYAPKLGLTPSMIRVVEPTQASFVGEMSAMRDAGVAGVLCFCSIEIGPVARDAKVIGYKPVLSGPTFTFDIISQINPGQLNGIRGVRLSGTTNIGAEYDRYVKAVNKHYPGTTVASDAIAFWGYAQFLHRTAYQAGPDPTRERVEKAMGTIADFGAGGAMAPVTFTGGQRIGTHSMLPVRCCNAKGEWIAEGPYRSSFVR